MQSPFWFLSIWFSLAHSTYLYATSSLLVLQTLRAELHGFRWGVLSPPSNHQSCSSKEMGEGNKSIEMILQWNLKKKWTNTDSGLQFHYWVELNLNYSVTRKSGYSPSSPLVIIPHETFLSFDTPRSCWSLWWTGLVCWFCWKLIHQNMSSFMLDAWGDSTEHGEQGPTALGKQYELH